MAVTWAIVAVTWAIWLHMGPIAAVWDQVGAIGALVLGPRPLNSSCNGN